MIVHEVVSLPPVDITTRDGIPVTTPTRTLLDLAAVADEEWLEEALDDALRRRLTTISRLRWRARELGPWPGSRMIRRLLDERAPGEPVPRSPLETRFLRLVRRTRLPKPERQHQIQVNGRLIAIVDFAYPEHRVAIETDGYRWHTGRRKWQSDLTRRNALVALGWLVVHVTKEDLRSAPDRVAEVISAALRDRTGPGAGPYPLTTGVPWG